MCRSSCKGYYPEIAAVRDGAADFIAAGTTPETVIQFKPSPEAEHRVSDLIEKEKDTGLSSEEKAELHHFLELEHILRMAKARARQILSRDQ